MITQNTIRKLQFICDECGQLIKLINFATFCDHYDIVNYIKTIEISTRSIKSNTSPILIDDDFKIYFKNDSKNKIQMSFDKLNNMKMNDLINYLNKQKNIL